MAIKVDFGGESNKIVLIWVGLMECTVGKVDTGSGSSDESARYVHHEDIAGRELLEMVVGINDLTIGRGGEVELVGNRDAMSKMEKLVFGVSIILPCLEAKGRTNDAEITWNGHIV